jgi:hypothetical protein
MSTREFNDWLKIHCGLFDGVRRFIKEESLAEWERVLASTPYSAAVEASRRIYNSEIRPKEYSDHAVAVKRAAFEISRQMQATAAGSGPSSYEGDRQADLRKRFEEKWQDLDRDERREWFRRACFECKGSADFKADECETKLLHDYAAILFAEAQATKFLPMSAVAAKVGEGWEF